MTITEIRSRHLIVTLVAALGCSDGASATDAGSPVDAPVTADADDATAVDAGAAEDGAATDAGAVADAGARTIVVVAGSTATHPNCMTVCAARGFTCAPSCRNRGFVHTNPNAIAGWAMYSSVGMGFTANEDRYLRCDEAVGPICAMTFKRDNLWACPPRSIDTGTPYTLQEFNCCCEQ